MMKMPIFILNSFYEGDVTGEIGEFKYLHKSDPIEKFICLRTFSKFDANLSFCLHVSLVLRIRNGDLELKLGYVD